MLPVKDVKQGEDTKFLGAHVPSEFYWEFKKAISKSKTKQGIALQHAINMYIDAVEKGEVDSLGKEVK